MTGHYDRTGKPVDALTWARVRDHDRRVAETTLRDGTWVSTVFLGLDYSFGSGPPLIFETMVFPRQGSWGELDMERYATEEDARAGHARMVAKWSSLPHRLARLARRVVARLTGRPPPD